MLSMSTEVSDTRQGTKQEQHLNTYACLQKNGIFGVKHCWESGKAVNAPRNHFSWQAMKVEVGMTKIHRCKKFGKLGMSESAPGDPEERGKIITPSTCLSVGFWPQESPSRIQSGPVPREKHHKGTGSYPEPSIVLTGDSSQDLEK